MDASLLAARIVAGSTEADADVDEGDGIGAVHVKVKDSRGSSGVFFSSPLSEEDKDAEVCLRLVVPIARFGECR